MLRYIELLSKHRTPSSAKWKAAPTKRQKEYNELKFSDVSIDEKRSAMSIEIRRLGEEQRRHFQQSGKQDETADAPAPAAAVPARIAKRPSARATPPAECAAVTE